MTARSGKSSQEDTRNLTATEQGMLAPLLLRAPEAAVLCSTSTRTWRTWGTIGKIPRPIHIGRIPFWRYDELKAWVDAGCPNRTTWDAMRE